MLKQVGFKDIAGKTVKAIATSYNWRVNKAAIVFTDETFAHITAIREHYEDDGKIEDYELEILDDIDRDAYVAAGVFTQDELDAAERERSSKLETEQRERRRMQYEQLRKEFEGK